MLWSLLLTTLTYHVCAAFGFGPSLGGTLEPLPASFNIGFISTALGPLLMGSHGNELLGLIVPAVLSMAILFSLDTLLATAAIDQFTMRRSFSAPVYGFAMDFGTSLQLGRRAAAGNLFLRR